MTNQISIRNPTTEAAWSDFSRNAATYNGILERNSTARVSHSGSSPGKAPNIKTGGKNQNTGTMSYSPVEQKKSNVFVLPEELQKKIEQVPVDETGLKVEVLRGYQKLGAQFVLYQGNALLGDEMGLGKTIQALTVMVSLRNSGATHFLVVCPASVLINWCREVSERSDLNHVKIHGADSPETFRIWKQYGGVGVTTYETLAKLQVDDDFNFDLLVADEAHYIKNPKAKRTQNLIKLKSHAKRILFMTGTPLENTVDEMIFLIRILKPSVATALEALKEFEYSAEFREKVADVYFRRTRQDVLKELPDIQIDQDYI